MQQAPPGYVLPPRPGGYPPPPLGMFPPVPGGMMHPGAPMMAPPPGMVPAPGALPAPPMLARPAGVPQPAQSLRPPPSLPRPAPAPRAKKLTGPRAEKQTTLYVGKIAATVDDATVVKLLEACGPIKSWKRMTDPESNAPKAFGFCEFEEADGVVRAMDHLNGLDVDGQSLLLKCNANTQKYIDDWKLRKAVEAAARKAAAEEATAAADKSTDAKAGDGSGDAALPPPPGDPDAFKDQQSLEKIMALVSDRAPVRASAPSAADAFLDSLDGGGGGGGSSSRRASERSRHSGMSSADREADRVEAAFERQRERDRQRASDAAAEADREYRDRLRKWEREERSSATARNRSQIVELSRDRNTSLWSFM